MKRRMPGSSLDRVRHALFEEVTFKLRPECQEGERHFDMLGNNFSGSENGSANALR